MGEETTAAPAPEVEEVVTSEPETNAEISEDDALSQVYDNLTNDEEGESEAKPENDEPSEPESADDAPDDDQEEPEAAENESEEVELPHDLPVKLKDGWGKIPEEMRDTITSAHREMAQKVSQASREVNAYKPIRGALEAAIKANPAIADMKPEEVAQQLPGLVQAGQQLKQNPVQAILTLAQQHGVAQHLAQALGGNVDGARFQQEISTLRQENERLRQELNPDRLRENFDSWHAETQTMSAVQKFANEAEHWGELEDKLPPFIEAAKAILPDSTAPEAVLEEAYNMALQRLLPDKAKAPKAASEAAPEPDPAKVESAKRATSVNVQGKSAGKPRPKTEDELLDEAWRKMQQA